MGLNDKILDFEGQSPVRSPFHKSLDFILFLLSSKVSEQSDQVAKKPDFLLRTINNDLKQNDES